MPTLPSWISAVDDSQPLRPAVRADAQRDVVGAARAGRADQLEVAVNLRRADGRLTHQPTRVEEVLRVVVPRGQPGQHVVRRRHIRPRRQVAHAAKVLHLLVRRRVIAQENAVQ
jgi:hypothetical protein